MSEEDTQVVESAETATEEELHDNSNQDESTGESESSEATEGSEQSSTETPEQRRARIKRMYEREFGKDGKKGSQKSGEEGDKEESSKKEVDDRYDRLELKTEGITSKKAQDIVLDYARYKGIDAIEALKSTVVKAEIAELEKKTSAPAPSKRTGSGATNDFDYWVGQAKKGNFPKGDREMMAKLRKARIFTK